MKEITIPSQRLMSLDALRGANMFFIMGGSGLLCALAAFWPHSAIWQWIASQMHHVKWDGFAQHDMIFPTFLLIAGIAFPFSLAKQRVNGKSNGQIFCKVLWRAAVLVLLGILVNNKVCLDFANLRYASVLGHIGLAWMFAAILTMAFGTKTRFVLFAAILVGYWLLLKNVGAPDAPEGAGVYSMEGCLVGYIDRMYCPGRLHLGIHDPEGLLSLIPAIGTALLGTLVGDGLRSGGVENGGVKKTIWLAIIGAALITVGWYWGKFFPINKNLWTSSFVCFAGGIGIASLAVFYFIIDVLRFRCWAFFFVVIGMNSITIYLAPKFGLQTAVDFLTADPVARLPEAYRELGGSVAYIAIAWAFLYFLYRRNIFLKV